MSRISTGTGDEGTTGLVSGARVPKTHPRVTAYGTVDEANDALGVAIAFAERDELKDALRRVQHDLFNLGADLASPAGVRNAVRIREADVTRLETLTDALEAELPPLTKFILPGGTRAAALLHQARSTVRRAERDAWALVGATRETAQGDAGVADVNPLALTYLNRLSDYLFLLARAENVHAGVEDEQWLGKEQEKNGNA